MARQDFPLNINRRRLLSAAALPVASIVPGAEPADTAADDVIQSSLMTLEAEPATFCAATAARLAEIAKRSRLRKESALPLFAKITREMEKIAFEDPEGFSGDPRFVELGSELINPCALTIRS
jgi:hypothetical protein